MTAKIPWFHPEVDGREADALRAVIDSGYINDGHVTRDFERRVAEHIGVRHCVAVTSGTAAISLALMGLGIGAGDEVIVPDLTFIATANAVRMTGAEARLVDVDPTRFAIDPEAVERAIGPKTRAIVPVDVNGRGAPYPALDALCRQHGLVMVCDAAEALGSRYRGAFLGGFGHAGCFSFSAAKTVSCGQGGMIATNDDRLHDRLRELKDQGRRQQGTGGDDDHPVMGFNFKLTNLQAAVGLVQMDRIEERIAGFRRRDAWYRERLADCGNLGIHLPPLPDDGEVRQWTDVLLFDREPVRAALAAERIDARAFWYPLHRQRPYAQPDTGFETAIEVSRRGLWLPSHFGLTEADADRVCTVIRKATASAAGRRPEPSGTASSVY